MEGDMWISEGSDLSERERERERWNKKRGARVLIF